VLSWVVRAFHQVFDVFGWQFFAVGRFFRYRRKGTVDALMCGFVQRL
jgi:hypothetical protein